MYVFSVIQYDTQLTHKQYTEKTLIKSMPM